MSPARIGGCATLALLLATAGAPVTAMAKSITVRPGESIQQAVDQAEPGDTVKVLSGDYHEPYHGTAAVLITKPLRLMASGQVRILPTDGQRDGIVVRGTKDHVLDGVEIKGFTVENFSNNGIWLEYVNHFNIENNASVNNGENGIWPTLSANGQVKKNVAYGAKDSALWVEASENVRVIDNDLHHSPTGLEVTISRNVTIEDNNVHDNTVGVGLYHPAAAGLDKGLWPTYDFGNWRVANNYVHDNNEPNTAEGGEVALLPPGLGMLLLGVDRVDVMQNRIERNQFVGVGMLDWCVAVPDCAASIYDIYAETGRPELTNTAVDDAHIVANKFSGNATNGGTSEFAPYAADILDVDGLAAYYLGFVSDPNALPSGTGNCQRDNRLIRVARPRDPGVSINVVPPVDLNGAPLLPTCD